MGVGVWLLQRWRLSDAEGWVVAAWCTSSVADALYLPALCTQVTPESTSVNCPGFDNVGLAFLTNFQLMTLTGWSFIMFRTIDNTSPFAGIYFIAIVMIGAYLLVSQSCSLVARDVLFF